MAVKTKKHQPRRVRGTAIRVEFPYEDLALLKWAAGMVRKSLPEFIIEAARMRAERVLG